MYYCPYQFSSVTQLCPTLCDPTDCSTPGLPVHHQLLECSQTHVHYVGDAIQPSHPLLSPSPPAFNLSQHQGLFKWVSSLHLVAKILEFQLQHQSFQGTFRTVLIQMKKKKKEREEERFSNLFQHNSKQTSKWQNLDVRCHLMSDSEVYDLYTVPGSGKNVLKHPSIVNHHSVQI